MSEPRQGAAAALLPDGRVVMTAGGSQVVEVYDPATGKFSRAGSLLNFYDGATAISMPSGKVLVAGPVALVGPGMELYDPASGKSAPVSLELPPGAEAAAKTNDYYRDPETATLLKDGRVLLDIYDFLVTYEPATGSFTQAGTISDPGQWIEATATLLPGGSVLFAAGYLEPDIHTQDATADVGLYDPATGFHTIASMKTARGDQTATLLPDGTVLIAGGTTNQTDALASAELFKS
jgi:hypothetical protein